MTIAPHQTRNSAVVSRHHGLDWLRIGAILLLILHHVGKAFVSGDWLVKLADLDWLAYPMLFVMPWRLALLFVVAGFASRAMFARMGPGGFARERSKRLLIPLIFAMLLIIPPQSWVSLQVNHGYADSFGHFLAYDGFRFGSLDGVTLPGWEHLWFVFYLWLYTMIAVASAALLPARLTMRLQGAVAGLAHGRRLLWLPLLYFVPARVLISFTAGESHGLFDDWLSDVLFLPCFLFGFGLAGAGELWTAIRRVWRYPSAWREMAGPELIRRSIARCNLSA